MFGIFKKKNVRGEVNTDKDARKETVKIKIDGMHCTSCSMNVDGELEDLEGVLSASTSYAKQESVVEYDPQKVSVGQMEAVIKELGYTIR